MNKRQARDEAFDKKRTWGELLSLVENSDMTGMAKINKSLTREEAGTIFKNMIAGKTLTEIPVGRSTLSIQNLLREFA